MIKRQRQGEMRCVDACTDATTVDVRLDSNGLLLPDAVVGGGSVSPRSTHEHENDDQPTRRRVCSFPPACVLFSVVPSLPLSVSVSLCLWLPRSAPPLPVISFLSSLFLYYYDCYTHTDSYRQLNVSLPQNDPRRRCCSRILTRLVTSSISRSSCYQ